MTRERFASATRSRCSSPTQSGPFVAWFSPPDDSSSTYEQDGTPASPAPRAVPVFALTPRADRKLRVAVPPAWTTTVPSGETSGHVLAEQSANDSPSRSQRRSPSPRAYAVEVISGTCMHGLTDDAQTYRAEINTSTPVSPVSPALLLRPTEDAVDQQNLSNGHGLCTNEGSESVSVSSDEGMIRARLKLELQLPSHNHSSDAAEEDGHRWNRTGADESSPGVRRGGRVGSPGFTVMRATAHQSRSPPSRPTRSPLHRSAASQSPLRTHANSVPTWRTQQPMGRGPPTGRLAVSSASPPARPQPRSPIGSSPACRGHSHNARAA